MMDDIPSVLDPDELMDLEEPESYDLDEDDDDIPDDPSTSPFQHFSSGPASNATSTASSPVANEDFSVPFNLSGKPSMLKRGRGRPRREGGKPTSRRGGTGFPRVRRSRPAGFSRCRGSRSVRQPDRMDFEFPYISPTSMDDMALPDSDAFFFPEREKLLPVFEELPYGPETWPGKVCAFCNLGERSQLGQGDMFRLTCPDGFTPQRAASECPTPPQQTPERELGDKSPRVPVTCRRNKNFSRSRSFLSGNEHVDELTIIGHVDEPSVNILYESTGQFYVHRNCALWSYEVTRAENQALENVGPVVLKSSSQKCSFCNHYGASLVCRASGCSKIYHFPCATASGAFQDLISLNVFCSNHLGEAAICSEAAICYTCKSVGDIANLMYCSSCGTHYHGSCVGLAQLPGVRAGWQCRKCRICQVCRVIGDETKLMSCEQCDKVYHASCQRPIVTSIPKYGWKCRCCRVCGDCGSRTPGAGLSSRWHLHYTVCDSCYQQRNKGCCCPVCQRAYRSHGHREMVQCSSCRKFVHGTCDPDADLGTYQQKKEMNPDYEYICLICKNSTPQQQAQLSGRPLMSKRPSTDDPGEMSASQESLYDDMSEFDSAPSDAESFRTTGLGKGKPYASKIAKKKLSYAIALPGRPKGFGKGVSGKQGFMKRQRLVDFGHKRGSKAKIRGIFGVPGVGLSRPVSDGKNDEEPGVENRLVLCSAKDKFVLTQDVCVMCGAFGIDQEGCLIACVQCGQCYHPYCLNIKVTKVILQKGWRCLDCTVCEGCGQRNDESRLILCDDCDVSYHTYCMDPPLDYVPHGNWKCKWCASCRTCGSTDPGFNSSWMNGCTECGPCASLVTCPSCNDPYSEGDLIVQCVQCERWLHGACDLIKTEMDAEKCAEDGYTCLLCRPRDVPPPHLVPMPMALKPPTPTKSPEVRNHANFMIDGVCLSESGNNLIKSLSLEHQGTRKKRKKLPPVVHDKEAGIMATIESVVAGGTGGENSFEDTKIEMVDAKDEPQEIYKEGMIWTKEDGPPPEGFTILAMDSGISVLRRKRQRNLQKLGIGGFLVRMRGFKTGQENDDIDTLPGQNTPTLGEPAMQIGSLTDDKPKKKPIRRKPKSKLAETFPPYLQEAFFGKDLMDLTDLKKEVESGSSDEEKVTDRHQAIKLTAEELLAMETAKQERNVLDTQTPSRKGLSDPIKEEKPPSVKEEEDGSGEDLKDVLALSTDLFDNDLVNSIINEGDELAKDGELDALAADDDGELAQTLGSSENSKDAKDELSDILGSNFSLESISNINSKDVEDIFKNVLTDESQESQLSQDANVFPSMPCQPPTNQPHLPSAPVQINPSTAIPQMHLPLNQGRSNTLPGVQHVSFPPSPYHSEYSNSPQFSPAFSEPPSPWVSINEGVDMEPMGGSTVGVPSTSNQRSSEKMKADESLGSGATISAVLYANMKHSEWKTEYPAWTDRYKQIIKKWRTLSQEEKAPYLQQARDNRSQLRMKKQQQSQTAKETPTSPVAAAKPQSGPSLSSNMVACAGPAQVASQSAQQPSSLVGAPSTEDQEKMAQQQKTAREAEQERQWKQLQAMRQHQAQQQQHVIQEQRVQAIARVQRTISDPQQQFHSQTSPLQVTTAPPETSPAASPRQFIGIKSPPFAHPSPPSTNIRTPTPSQSPVHELQHSKSQTPEQDSFVEVSGPVGNSGYPSAKGAGGPDTFTPPPQARAPFSAMRPNLPGRPDQPEITRQLRDLLQRQQQQQQQQQQQHMKTFDPVQIKSAPRIWNPTDTAGAESPTTPTTTSEDNITFREPLPPPSGRPRGPLTAGVRPGAPRMQQEGRLQGLDARLKLILQQQTRVAAASQQPQTPGVVRFPSSPSAPRPATIEQYEQLLQRQQQLQSRNTALEQQQQQQQQQATSATNVRVPEAPPSAAQQKAVTGIPQQLPVIQQNQTMPVSNDQEIPDNVTAELEKLEQETGTMAELQGVSEILGGLGDDDDELLAEMGADFNILEYADPELEALAGEKTNILDLELEEDHLKQEKKKEALLQQRQQQQRQNLAAAQGVAGQAGPHSGNNRFEPAQEQPKPVHTPTTAPPLEEPNTAKQPQLEASPLIPPQPAHNSSDMTIPEATPPPTMPPQPPAVNPPPTPPQPENNNPVQPQQQPPTASPQSNLALTTQQIHQQLLHQVGCKMSKYVQQAAASGKPMPPGAKLQTTDGIVGIVLPNNNVQLQIPPNYHQRFLVQLQNQKFAMRVGRPAPRPTAPNVNQPPQSQQIAPGQMVRPRMALPTPPPPPPPYPGPPPPYPGNVVSQQHQQQQQQQQPHQEQPLLLEDLLEQEKREQEKQNHGHPTSRPDLNARQGEPESALLSDHDFERLKADVFNSGHVPETPPPANPMGMVQQQQQWQPPRQNPPPQPTTEITTRVQMFNANLLPAPPLPPENIVTEQDKQTQLLYENWLHHQNNVLTQQLKYYETEVQKLRKSRKSLNSKQRQLRKSGNQLSEVDSNELQRISSEQAILQKHLESSRKQSRQHGMLIQEYRNKQQPQKPMMNAQLPSPLGPPGSSPIHHPTASHSPLLSPQQSPMTQHNSPMSSPGPMIAHSPGHGPVAALLQSPSGNVSPMQPSPRIGTPLSQEGSPGPIQSPSHVCPPPPAPRMTSPQHRRVVTSPVSYTGDIRNAVTQMRFVRPTVDQHALQRLRTQTSSPLQGFPQKGSAPSPLNSPPLNQMTLLQKQLHQQALLHQQQNTDPNNQPDVNLLHSQRVTQLIQHRNLNRQQGVIQQSNLTPQQHQLLAKQQQLALQLQARHNQQQAQQQQQQAPPSPMPPKSPLHTQQQTMSPHSMPSSPMPPKSPMVAFNTPGSPAARSNYQPPSSPMMHQYQTPTSPMMLHSPHSMRRPPSSPAMPERPTSVENPGTPRTPYEVHIQENMHTGGGNPNNPMNPIPLPPPGFFYSKLGLRGGAPMWSGFGRGEKRVPTPPISEENKKKESHISKVSILKKKTPVSRSNAIENALSRSSPKLFASSSHQDLADDGSSSSSSSMQQKRFTNDKPLQLQSEMVEFDDDNSTLLSSEVSLSSAAQPNDDEIEMTETLSQNDLGEVLASPMEPDQISDDMLLFPGNMMVDMPGGLQYSDKDEIEEEYANIVIRSPTTSDDEFIMQDHQRSMKKYNILNITESPEQDNTTEPEDDENTQPFEESEVVIIDQSTKSPEEQISTKEDFEELIDEGSRKEKLKLVEPKAEKQPVYSFPPAKTQVVVTRPSNLAKVSFIAATPILQNSSKLSSEPQQLILTPTSKITTTNASSKLTSIILTHNAVRSNILSVQGSNSQGITIVSATNSQIASILPSKFTVPVISASAVRQLPNVKVIDKPSTSLSLSAPEGSLPKKIFDDDSVSPDNGSFEDEKKNVFEEKMSAAKLFSKTDGLLQRQKITILADKRENVGEKEKVQILTQSTKSSSPVIIHHAPPELKMTAQVIQDMQITATETLNSFDGSSEDKSVVISIPSPTPSQEQMLDNIALQALEENRRREFESFEDVLDMIENMQHTETEVDTKQPKPKELPVESKKQTMPQLSPLSQPADLTTNMANASQQLRTLLSTIQTTSTAHTSNIETQVKSGQKVVNVSSVSSPVVASRVIQAPVIVPNIKPKPQVTKQVNVKDKPQEIPKKPSLTLTAMLQNQPAATPTTKPSADTITAASLLATPVSLSRTSFSPALAQAQPNAIIAAVTANTSGISSSTTSSSVISSTFRTSTNLLHTQLTKSRTKSLDDIKDLKGDDNKPESATSDNDIVSSIKQELTSNKFSAVGKVTAHQSLVNKGEDSQNVLLKKLLQNTACASTQSPPPSTTTSITVSAPSVNISGNSEQKPTLSSLLPPVIKSEPQVVTTTTAQSQQVRRPPIRETSFVSNPTTAAPTSTNQQLHIDVKKCAPSVREELLSPPTPRSSCSQDSSLQTPPLIIKKENNTSNGLVEVKRELLDETSQNSNISDQGVKLDSVAQIKEETESGEVTQDKIMDKEELKKQKRRMYNQKRRQNQLLNKENNKPNKRARKNSKLDEDYDSYIDSVLNQIRHLPPMVVSEPVLVRNYGVMPIFGSGDLSKIGTKSFDPRCGDLVGSYGNAAVPDCADFYSTKPYGDEDPIPEKPPASTQRGFYDQEFPLIRFDTDDDKKFDMFSRDDTPDSVISCSSPECGPTDGSDRYLGLKLISDDEDEDTDANSRRSPSIPLIKPIAIRLKPAGLYLKENVKVENKENVLKESDQEKMRPMSTPPTPTKETDNIKVTLTLTSSAAEDIVGVLRDLANILQIPPPTSYQIVDRTTSPAGQKLGMYRTKGKDGKEGAPIDIQSILNGAAKFCKHCDVVILTDLIRKKLSDLPFLAKDFELLSEGEELYFCSSACYMQFALMHRSPSIPEDKAAAIIDHLSQKDKQTLRTQRQTLDGYETRANRMSVDIKQEDTRSHFSQFFGSAFKPGNRFGAKQSDPTKSHRNLSYKFWMPGCLQPVLKNKKPTDKEIMEILYQMGITVTPPKMPEDTRKCMFCQMIGDGVADGPARLLNFDVDKWVHLNCALWSDGVYETVNGALMNLENAVQQSLTTVCVHCSKFGATIRCFKTRCTSVYHLSCAVRDSCVFFKNKTVFCTAHVPKNEKDNELTTLSVGRRVYVNRDENRQVAAVMHHSDTNNLLRVGGLIFLNVGQLLPHQLQNFHTPNYIYPIGYKIIRFYWSMRHLNKRCRYVCSIHDNLGRPEFRVLVQEYNEEDVEFKDHTPRGTWLPILEKIAAIRRENQCLQMFPKFISGEDLFGLTEPAIVRVLESLPGIETLVDYKIKYGRNPLLELPLAINPTGAARTEPRLRHQTHWKRPHTHRTTGSSSRPLFGPSSASPSTPTSLGESVCPYSKQFVHSKSSQYKKMKQEWRNNVFLARSKIQGLGLYAARDLEKHTMVIEYIGEVIRTELSECREKQYEAKNRGIYMFRLDDDRVVDATLSGGLARYINHSCNPNCVAETVEIDRDLKIIIFSKRRIQRGEELAYDYKFDIEDDQNKISCMCGAPNCRKWMN